MLILHYFFGLVARDVSSSMVVGKAGQAHHFLPDGRLDLVHMVLIRLVPVVGVEPTLLAERDFESDKGTLSRH
jgi:hypothetical protein